RTPGMIAYILSLAILGRKISLMRRRDTFILSNLTISAYTNAYPRRGRRQEKVRASRQQTALSSVPSIHDHPHAPCDRARPAGALDHLRTEIVNHHPSRYRRDST